MEAATAPFAGTATRPRPSAGLDRLRSDRALAERFRGGDEVAFTVLFERHRMRVFAVCLGVLGSREDAQDALQEVFVTAAARLHDAPPTDLRPWLATVARNKAIDIARGRPALATGREPEPSHEDGPARTAQRRAELEELIVALRELPERQRSALLMRELAGYSYAEIGHALEVDDSGVRSLIARARITLREHRAGGGAECESVRRRLAGEVDGRRRPAAVRRHLRACSDCRAFKAGLRGDAKALGGLVPTGGIGIWSVIAILRGGRAAVVAGTLAKGGGGGATAAKVVAAAILAAGAVEGARDLQVAGGAGGNHAAASGQAAGGTGSAAASPVSAPGSGGAFQPTGSGSPGAGSQQGDDTSALALFAPGLAFADPFFGALQQAGPHGARFPLPPWLRRHDRGGQPPPNGGGPPGGDGSELGGQPGGQGAPQRNGLDGGPGHAPRHALGPQRQPRHVGQPGPRPPQPPTQIQHPPQPPAGGNRPGPSGNPPGGDQPPPGP